MLSQKRVVYGTRTKKFHYITPEDRDYSSALTIPEFKRLGKKASREKYLQPRLF